MKLRKKKKNHTNNYTRYVIASEEEELKSCKEHSNRIETELPEGQVEAESPQNEIHKENRLISELKLPVITTPGEKPSISPTIKPTGRRNGPEASGWNKFLKTCAAAARRPTPGVTKKKGKLSRIKAIEATNRDIRDFLIGQQSGGGN